VRFCCRALSYGIVEVKHRPLTRSVSWTDMQHEPLADASGWIIPSKLQAYRHMSQHSTAELTTSFGEIFLVRSTTSFTPKLALK
jgi:hypothetical protein